MKKILFISHYAGRTGAPRSLLFLLQWLKANSDLEFRVLLKKGGELQSEFENIGLIGNFTSPRENKNNFCNKIQQKLYLSRISRKKYLWNLQKKIVRENFDLIYANTVANGEVLEFLSGFLNCPVICHVRELEQMISHHIGKDVFAKTKKHTDIYIAVSHAVKDNLIKNHDIPENKIKVIYNCIPDNSLSIDRLEKSRSAILESLGIPSHSQIVCASGTTDWRKGVDLFIQLAKSIIQKYCQESIHFIWVGGAKNGIQFSQLLYDVKNANLLDNIHFLGTCSNPLEYYAACDIFSLVSREDPFPRVCLEAASLGKPIVCFDNAGGEKEFVEDDCGFVVPYLDIQTMADKVIHLLENSELRHQMGSRAMQKVKEKHNAQLIGQQITQVIQQVI